MPIETEQQAQASLCTASVYWIDADYVGRCVLRKNHGGPHFDGLESFDRWGLRPSFADETRSRLSGAPS